MTHIPSPDHDYAAAKGLGRETIARLWTSHVKGSEERGYDCGGTPWRRYVDRAAERMNDEAADTVELDANARAHEADRIARERAKQAADKAYARDAISLEQYLDSLMLKEGTLTEAEEALLDCSRLPGEDTASYMHRAMAEGSAKRAPRQNPCAGRECGNEAVSWVSNGYRVEWRDGAWWIVPVHAVRKLDPITQRATSNLEAQS